MQVTQWQRHAWGSILHFYNFSGTIVSLFASGFPQGHRLLCTRRRQTRMETERHSRSAAPQATASNGGSMHLFCSTRRLIHAHHIPQVPLTDASIINTPRGPREKRSH
ncbi:hypothetical protein O3P69_001363 [Scylla paramamosain]|uniref:Uncharacterized protein n=1 Tax=Scylla paramamosain TaxID=85552 RepID=A0AAW0UQ05_SCYPA